MPTLMILALALVLATQTPLKVYISADMEGIGGVATRIQSASSGAEYEKYRRLMTLE